MLTCLATPAARPTRTPGARARGRALALAVAWQEHSADNPVMAELGRQTLDAVLG